MSVSFALSLSPQEQLSSVADVDDDSDEEVRQHPKQLLLQLDENPVDLLDDDDDDDDMTGGNWQDAKRHDEMWPSRRKWKIENRAKNVFTAFQAQAVRAEIIDKDEFSHKLLLLLVLLW